MRCLALWMCFVVLLLPRGLAITKALSGRRSVRSAHRVSQRRADGDFEAKPVSRHTHFLKKRLRHHEVAKITEDELVVRRDRLFSNPML